MKRRIGLTQRVDDILDHAETRDALDQRWAALLEALGFAPVPLCNVIQRTADYLDALDLGGVIVTGGNDVVLQPAGELPPRDRFEYGVLAYCRDRQIPVLGVCRGMQVMNVFFKGSLSRIAGHVATRHPVTVGAEQRSVNSFHNFAIHPEDLGQNLSPLATCDDGSIEAFRHQHAPFCATMWHPEREEPAQAADVLLIRGLFNGANRW